MLGGDARDGPEHLNEQCSARQSAIRSDLELPGGAASLSVGSAILSSS